MYNSYSDGASQQNNRLAACAYAILDTEGNILYDQSIYLGNATNNVAEAYAIIFCLNAALAGGIHELIHHSDSELIISQINGSYKINNEELKKLHVIIADLASKFTTINFIHVPRSNHYISHCDALTRVVIDLHK